MTAAIKQLGIRVLLLFMVLIPAITLSASDQGDLGIIRLRYAAVVVRDYDEALRWYTNILGFEKTEEGWFGTTPGGKVVTSGKATALNKRWIVVAPRGQKDFGIVLELAKPYSPADSIHNYQARVGTETRWVFEVEDCRRFYDLASKRGVKFVEPPVDQPWGVTEAMFEDLYRNVFVVKSFRPKSLK